MTTNPGDQLLSKEVRDDRTNVVQRTHPEADPPSQTPAATILTREQIQELADHCEAFGVRDGQVVYPWRSHEALRAERDTLKADVIGLRVNAKVSEKVTELLDRSTTRLMELEAERDRLQARVRELEVSEDRQRLTNIAKWLAAQYREDPTGIAKLCDETLDRSGTLLGWVRDEADDAADLEARGT